jgi:hypothetical protein
MRAASAEYGRPGKRKPGLNSPSIKKQVGKHFSILLSEIDKESGQRYSSKVRANFVKASLGKKTKKVERRY